MKNLKRILCLCLCVLTMLTFSACGKSEDGEDSTPKNPNENYSNEMTLSEVLGATYSVLESKMKTEYGNTTCFAESVIDNENLYESFVYKNVYILKALSNCTELSAGVYYQGTKSEIYKTDGFADKLELLYITRENENYVNNIKIYAYFSVNGHEFAENLEQPRYFDLFYYEIEFNEKTNKLGLTSSVERSRGIEYSNTDSSALYYSVDFSSEVLTATKFERLQNFNLNDDHLYSGRINDFKYVVFSTNTNGIVTSSADTKSPLVDMIKPYLIKYSELEQNIFNLNAEQLILNENLTDELAKVLNSERFSDFSAI